MDKNIIRKQLTERFLSEAATPGIDMVKKMKKEETKVNTDGVKAIEKDMASYEKTLKQEDENNNTMPVNKFNYTDDNEKTYHDEMEILNGQEMIEYTSEPGEGFVEKAKEGIEGSSRMGNAIGGNAEETFGASSDDFGKNLVKRVKSSSEKRADAEIQTYGMGDVQIPTGRKVQTAITAVGAKTPKGDTTKLNKTSSPKVKTVNETITPNKQTKESMKRLKFKKEFNGVGNALKLIPESYRVDKKEFEMTDGNESYRIRWEGNLSEGNAVVLMASDKKMVNEDISRMKALFNYKSESTLGLVKGNARLDENAAFADVFAKTKKLLGESEDIESVKAETKEPDGSGIAQAPEAKKHVKGSANQKKDGTAPAAKTGDLDKVVKQAPEAKKHVEGSVSNSKENMVKNPTEAPFEDADVNQAPEAKAHVETKKGTKLAKKAPIVKENEEIGDEDEAEVEDTFYKSDDEDSSSDSEPSALDIKSEPIPAIAGGEEEEEDIVVPPPSKVGGPKLMVSKSTGQHFIMVGKNPIPCPEHLVTLAKKNPQSALDKMEDEAEMAGGEDELDEGWFDRKSPEEIKKAGMEAINAHPVKKKTYAELVQNYPDRVEKYLLFVGKNPTIKYISWDNAKNDFISSGNFSVASGEGTAGK